MAKKLNAYIGIVVGAVIIVSALVLHQLSVWPFSETNDDAPVYLSKTPAATGGEIPAENDSFEVVEANQVAFTTEIVAEDLEIPWSVAFTSEDRILVTERPGRVRQIVGGELVSDPVHVFEAVDATGEAGAMGMVLDPDYQQNKWLYICYATGKNGSMINQVVRFTDSGDFLTDKQLILDDIPAGRYHAGCELAFGPDDKLYVTTGDATDPQLAQNQSNIAGKILRLNKDGSIPADNPIPGSPIWTLGHRNSQGIDWYPGTSILFATEHGPSGFDGPGGGDEINLIKKGQNYGWPEVSHQESAAGMIDPLVVFTPAIAPSSGVFLDSNQIPEFENNFFVAMLNGKGIMRFVMNPDNPEEILMYERLPGLEYGRIREVVVGPDGILYFATSNRDGRGQVQSGDDKIIRMVPFRNSGEIDL